MVPGESYPIKYKGILTLNQVRFHYSYSKTPLNFLLLDFFGS